MARRGNSSRPVTGPDKLDHRVHVLLKEWAGMSGFYGYKDMGLDEILELVNTQGYKTEVDRSDPSARIVVMFKDGSAVRKSKFVLDEQGRALKAY